MIRPSSLPALAQCGLFKSDPKGSDATMDGTVRHQVLANLLNGDTEDRKRIDSELSTLEGTDQIEGVGWAFEFIKFKAPMSNYPLNVERKGSFMGPDFQEISGTPDVVCGPVVFDLKWRWSDYKPQMAAYALMQFVGDDDDRTIVVYVLFAESQKVVHYTFTRQEAESIVYGIIGSVESATEAKPNDFCGWCERRLTCQSVVKNLNAVIENRDDFQLETWHSSEIKTAEDMGKALRIARVVKEWCESVEFHAKEMAIKQGMVPTGFKLQSRQGNRFVSDLGQAFALSGLSQEKFLESCEVKLSKLVDAYAEVNVMKKKPAEKALEAKLGSVIQRKKPSESLVKE